jgi:hypothetical protein
MQEFKGATPKGVIIGAKKSLWKGNVVAPAAIVNFMNKMDEHVQELSACAQAQIDHSKIVADAARDPAANWKTISKSLALVSENAGRASQYFWLAPATASAFSKGGVLSSKASLYPGKGESVLAITAKISGYATRVFQAGDEFVKYKRTGMSTEDAIGMVALKTALGYLPVLGNFYAEALDLVPGMKKWFLAIIKDHTARIDAIEGLWAHKPTAFRQPSSRTQDAIHLATGSGHPSGRRPGPIGAG